MEPGGGSPEQLRSRGKWGGTLWRGWKWAIIETKNGNREMNNTMEIRVEHLTKRFYDRGRRQTTTAVSDLTLTAPDGALMGLLGPSGCGKSTTLNMICGLEKPDEGRIFFGGEDVTDLPPEVSTPTSPYCRTFSFPWRISRGPPGPPGRRWSAGPGTPPPWWKLRPCWTGGPGSCPAASSSVWPSPGLW